MASTTKFSERLIALEVLVGVGLSVIFMIIALNSENDFWGDSYFSGLFRFYGGTSIIFFASVFFVGIIGALKSKQSKSIWNAILYSILFWVISLVVTAVAAEFLRLLSVYFMLAGVIYGFNYGLNRNMSNERET